MDLTIGEIARITGYAPESLRNLAKKGKLPGAYKLGGSWRINREQFERYRNGTTGTNINGSTHSDSG